MKKLVIELLAIACFALAPLEGIILPASNLAPVEKVLENVDQQTLVMFDVDDTLLIAKDPVLRPCNRTIFWKIAREVLDNPEITPPGKYTDNMFASLIFDQMEFELVNPKVVEIVHQLQQKKIKTIAFTRMFTGSFGVIPSMEDWRISQLRKECLDFSQAFPQYPELLIDVPASNVTSGFKQGVLCANKQEKGPVLVAFLNEVGWEPTKIIFVDNKLDYVQSVEKALEGSGIEFIGLHYTEGDERPCLVNEEKVRLQIIHLAKTGKWIGESFSL